MGSLRGLYLTKPHSGLIVDGRKSIIVRGEEQDLSGEWALVEKDKALGRMVLGSPYSVPGDRFQEFYFAHRVRENERTKWWGDKDLLFFSDILAFEPFDDGPVAVPVPPGTTLIIDDLPLDEKGYRLDKCMHCKAAPEVVVLWANAKGRAWFCRKCLLEWATKGDGRGEINAAYYVKDGRVSAKWEDRAGKKIKGKSGREIYDALEMIAAMEGEKAHTGAMIALFLPDVAAQRLALKTDSDQIKVVPPEEMHITLCYLGDSGELADKKGVISALVAGIAQQGGPVRGVVGGLGQFNTAEEAGGNALYASFDSPALSSFREAMVAVLDVAGVKMMTNHGFTPHITLAYLPPGMKPDLELPNKVPILFDRLTLAWGGERTSHPLPQVETKAKKDRSDKFVWEEGDLVFENETGEKGSAASGNWAHTSFNRIDVWKGGSDPSGTFGGGLASLGLDKDSTVEERREASDQFREDRTGAVMKRMIDAKRVIVSNPVQDPSAMQAAKAWGTKNYLEWYQSLSDEERGAISTYTSVGYKAINPYWRYGAEFVSEYKRDMAEKKTPFLDSALSRAVVPEDVVVTRGVGGTAMNQIFSTEVGEMFTDKGFGSTSVAQEWPWGEKTVRIFVPKGTNGGYVSSGMPGKVLGIKDECELLLARGTRYMMMGKGRENIMGVERDVAYVAVVAQGVKGMEWGQKPYTLDNPPPRIAGLPAHGKRIWISAFNSAFEQYNGNEQKANAVAWSSVKRKYHKEGDQWVANKSVVRASKSVDRMALFAEKYNLDLEHVGDPIPFVFDRNVLGTVTVVKYADQEGRKVWRGFLSFDQPIPYGEDLLHAMTVGMKSADDIDAALDLAHEQLLSDEKTLLALSDDELAEMYAATQAMLADSIKSLAADLSPAQMGIVLDKVVEIVGEKGSAASGNWLHTSFNRMDVGKGGSDPSGMFGGGLVSMGLDKDSTVEERRAASAQLRQEREERGGAPHGTEPKGDQAVVNREKLDDWFSERASYGGWIDATNAERGAVKHNLVTNLSEGAGVSYDDANRFIRQWSYSSNDSDMRSLGLQESASETYNVPMSDFTRGRIASAKQAYGAKSEHLLNPADERKLLTTMYAQTQQALRDQGFKPGDTIRLQRGVALPSSVAGGWQAGDIIPVIGNGLESWSVSNSIANRFSTGSGLSVVFEMDVPIEMIAGTCLTGFGCLTEGEVIVIGSVAGSRSEVVSIK